MSIGEVAWIIMGWVYILQSDKNGRYYIGSAINVEQRLGEHNSGKTKSLRYLLPVKVVFKQQFTDLLSARRAELKLKRYKSRSILERIIKDGYFMGH